MHHWQWMCQGRYGAFFVDKFDVAPNATSGSWGTPIRVPTRKLGKEIADALNAAFNDGMMYGASLATNIHTGENRAESAHILFHVESTGQAPGGELRCSMCTWDGSPFYRE